MWSLNHKGMYPAIIIERYYHTLLLAVEKSIWEQPLELSLLTHVLMLESVRFMKPLGHS